MKLFIVDWCKDATESNLLSICNTTTHTIVGYELIDSNEALKKIAELKPDAVIINYGAKPYHGRIIAESIFKGKSIPEVRLYFINGEEDDNERVAYMGICLSADELLDMLS